MSTTLLTILRRTQRLSERALSELANVSRVTLRSAEQGEKNVTLQSIQSIANALDYRMDVLIYPKTPCRSQSSTVAVSLQILKNGEDSWPYHLMEMVDDFRATKDGRLILLPPVDSLPLKYKALIASTVCTLCEEVGLAKPDWAAKSYFLQNPWFVAGMESLKASAILESPLFFRRNNIFVQDNFFKRA